MKKIIWVLAFLLIIQGVNAWEENSGYVGFDFLFTGVTTYNLNESNRQFLIRFNTSENLAINNITLYKALTGTSPTYSIGIQYGNASHSNGSWIKEPLNTTINSGVGIQTFTYIQNVSSGFYWIIIKYASGTINQANMANLYFLSNVSGFNLNNKNVFDLSNSGTEIYVSTDGVSYNLNPMSIFNLNNKIGSPYRFTYIGQLNTNLTSYGQYFTSDSNYNLNNFSLILDKVGSPTFTFNLTLINGYPNTSQDIIKSCVINASTLSTTRTFVYCNVSTSLISGNKYTIYANPNPDGVVSVTQRIRVYGVETNGIFPSINTFNGSDSMTIFTTNEFTSVTNNSNADTHFRLGIITPPSDTCTYSSGNWTITNNCTLSTNTNVLGNNIFITGNINVVITANLTNYSMVIMSGGAKVYMTNRGGFK